LSLAFPRVLLALTVLGYASIRDVNAREVPDKVWLVSFPAGLALTVADVSTGVLDASDVLISSAAASVLGFALFYAGFYGGADSKALLFLAVTVPAYTEDFKPVLKSLVPVPVLTVFCNSVLVSLIYPATVLALNLVDLMKGENPLKDTTFDSILGKIVLLATARRIELEKLKRGPSYFPAEKVVVENGIPLRKPIYFVGAEADRDSLIKALEKYEPYRDSVLASPTIPMIVFIALGLALLPIGNLMLSLISFSLIG
jgi:Flp pilus assembly protein protease CpaA